MEARMAMSEELDRQAEEKALAQKQGPSDILFSKFMRDWLDVKSTTVDLNTYVSYKSAVEKFIIPYFDKHHPSLKLTEVTAKHIQDYYTYEMKERKVSANTVKHRHASISNALKYAVRMDLIPGNPASKVELPRLGKYTASYYNEKELGELFNLVKGTSLELGVFLAS